MDPDAGATYSQSILDANTSTNPGALTVMEFAIRSALRPVLHRLRHYRDEVALTGLRMGGVELGRHVKIYGRLHLRKVKGSRMEVGEGVIFNSRASRNTLEARGPNIIKLLSNSASLLVGDDTGITSATISVVRQITIGKRVLIGSGVMITDSDHHLVSPLRVEDRRHSPFPPSSETDAVIIEDDVFIGARSIVLKGVTIGKGSVIGAASVVTRSIPPGVIAAGNPCAPVRSLNVSRS